MQCSNRYKGRSDPPSAGGPKGSALLSVLLVVFGVAPAAAQSVQHFSLDTVISLDDFGGENVSNHPQIIVDISGGVRISEHLQAYIRPWFRLPRPNTPTSPVPDWTHELYQGGIRYERPANRGRLATRLDIGYNVSPIGLGIIDTRPSLNPTISSHISYLSPECRPSRPLIHSEAS